MKKILKIFVVFLIMTVFLPQTKSFANFNDSTTYIFDLPYYKDKAEIFKYLSTTKTYENAIVFLGDSITDQAPWEEFFPNKDASIINRGIAGDNTNGVYARSSDVVSLKPKKIFLMIGINDLLADSEPEAICQRYAAIVENIKNQLPECELYIQSILPINTNIFAVSLNNEKVNLLNEQLQKLANNQDKIYYIDLYNAFVFKGQLNDSFTTDGIHLNKDGYLLWVDKIEKYL